MAFCAYYVGVEMLEVEVAAPDVGVDSPGFMQPADPFRLCRELKVQLTGGESPPGPLAWVVVDALLLFVSFFFFFFGIKGCMLVATETLQKAMASSQIVQNQHTRGGCLRVNKTRRESANLSKDSLQTLQSSLQAGGGWGRGMGLSFSAAAV